MDLPKFNGKGIGKLMNNKQSKNKGGEFNLPFQFI